MASLNPATWHGLRDLGALAPGLPGRRARARPTSRASCRSSCSRRGKAGRRDPEARGARSGSSTPSASARRDERLRDPVGRRRRRARDRDRPGPDRHRVARGGADGRGRARRRRSGARPRQDRRDRAAPRHRPDRARASCAASGCESGALASTVAHDAHNIVVVGVNDDDMARAVGGSRKPAAEWSSSTAGSVRAELPLPVAGCSRTRRSTRWSPRAAPASRRRATLGCELRLAVPDDGVPALSVIPSLKITDRGLVDVDRFELVPLEA